MFPITDSGTKKSPKGLLVVEYDSNGEIIMRDQCSAEEEETGLLKVIYKDDIFYNQTTFKKVREKLNN